MGAWSHQPFGNDDACDWAYELEDVTDFSVIEETFDHALDEEHEYLEAPDGSEIVAAAETLAKLLGKGTQTDSYTEAVDAWVKSISIKPSADLPHKAQRALTRVIGSDSELAELWAEGGDEEWKASVQALKAVLR